MEKIALYGLGIETQKALADLEDIHEIVGLLDGFRTDGVFYGKRVISFEDAVRAGVVLIVVVARPGSCRAIAKKSETDAVKGNIPDGYQGNEPS